MTLAARQALMAQFLDDPAVEARVRAEPEEVAAELAVPLDYVRWLARIPPERVGAFRASDQVKRRRAGELGGPARAAQSPPNSSERPTLTRTWFEK